MAWKFEGLGVYSNTAPNCNCWLKNDSDSELEMNFAGF